MYIIETLGIMMMMMHQQKFCKPIIFNRSERWGLGGLVVYSSDSHIDRTGTILAAAFGYTLVTTDLYRG